MKSEVQKKDAECRDILSTCEDDKEKLSEKLRNSDEVISHLKGEKSSTEVNFGNLTGSRELQCQFGLVILSLFLCGSRML